MNGKLAAIGVACLSLFVAACDGSAAGSCSTAQDVGTKMTALTDDLQKAQNSGKIDQIRAAEIAQQIIDAARKFGAAKDVHSHCEALDRLRKDTGL